MRKTVAFIILLVCITTVTGLCEKESPFFALADTYIQKFIDCSDLEIWEIKSDYDNPEVYRIGFDFTSGNQAITLNEKGKCKLYFFIEDSELMSGLMQMLTVFERIENQLPKGKTLEYRLRFSDDEIQYITSNTIKSYYKWLTE